MKWKVTNRLNTNELEVMLNQLEKENWKIYDIQHVDNGLGMAYFIVIANKNG